MTSSSWLWRFRDVYDMLWKMVIRPPRDLYTEDELGPDKFRLGKKSLHPQRLGAHKQSRTAEMQPFLACEREHRGKTLCGVLARKLLF